MEPQQGCGDEQSTQFMFPGRLWRAFSKVALPLAKASRSASSSPTDGAFGSVILLNQGHVSDSSSEARGRYIPWFCFIREGDRSMWMGLGYASILVSQINKNRYPDPRSHSVYLFISYSDRGILCRIRLNISGRLTVLNSSRVIGSAPGSTVA